MSENLRNPFTPTFGKVPPYPAGRDDVLQDMRTAFKNGAGDPHLSTILVGARGTGKTALLQSIANEALEESWISANVSCAPGMLEDIMLQLVGYYVWSTSTQVIVSIQDARRGVGQAQEDFRTGILEQTYHELSSGDKRFLEAMLPDEGTSTLAQIAERMGVRSNYASQYKSRLLMAGVIEERGWNCFDFALPGMRDCVERLQQ